MKMNILKQKVPEMTRYSDGYEWYLSEWYRNIRSKSDGMQHPSHMCSLNHGISFIATPEKIESVSRMS